MYEKIIKRDDGLRVKIRTWYFEYQGKLEWRFQTSVCPKGKRTWTSPVNHDRYAWRQLNQEDRKADDICQFLTLASPEEVYDAMLEAWQLLRPEKL